MVGIAWVSSDGAADNLAAFFDGVVDEVAVFDQALGAQQIAVLDDAGVAGGLQNWSTTAAPPRRPCDTPSARS